MIAKDSKMVELKVKDILKPSAAKGDFIQRKKLVTGSFDFLNLCAMLKPESLHPKLESLIYWRDVKKSGLIFCIGLSILLVTSMFSSVSVVAYLSLLALIGGVVLKIYKLFMFNIQEDYPLKTILEYELTLSKEQVQKFAGNATAELNIYIEELRRLFLFENIFDSFKFASFLWFLTYIGAYFNGMTLLTMSFIAVFTLPKIYERNQRVIEPYLHVLRSKINGIADKMKGSKENVASVDQKISEKEN